MTVRLCSHRYVAGLASSRDPTVLCFMHENKRSVNDNDDHSSHYSTVEHTN